MVHIGEPYVMYLSNSAYAHAYLDRGSLQVDK